MKNEKTVVYSSVLIRKIKKSRFFKVWRRWRSFWQAPWREMALIWKIAVLVTRYSELNSSMTNTTYTYDLTTPKGIQRRVKGRKIIQRKMAQVVLLDKAFRVGIAEKFTANPRTKIFNAPNILSFYYSLEDSWVCFIIGNIKTFPVKKQHRITHTQHGLIPCIYYFVWIAAIVFVLRILSVVWQQNGFHPHSSLSFVENCILGRTFFKKGEGRR